MMEKIAKVISINSSREKGVSKERMEEGFFKENHGLVGDAHAGKWHRQVSLLAIESIEKIADRSYIAKFAENITTEGVCLHELAEGTKLKVGDSVQEVTQIGKECHNSCAIKEEIGKCIMPREGIFTKVLVSGKVEVDDEIEVLADGE
jgi:MOSC domain-containing protein YiiM